MAIRYHLACRRSRSISNATILSPPLGAKATRAYCSSGIDVTVGVPIFASIQPFRIRPTQAEPFQTWCGVIHQHLCQVQISLTSNRVGLVPLIYLIWVALTCVVTNEVKATQGVSAKHMNKRVKPHVGDAEAGGFPWTATEADRNNSNGV